MRNYITLFILIFFSYSFGQNKITMANNYIYAAELMLKENKYNHALKYFEKSFELNYTENPNYLLDAAFTAFKLKKDNVAHNFLERSVTNYKIPLDFLKSYAKLKEFQNNKIFQKVISNYNTFYGLFYSNKKDLDVFLEIEELKNYDQYVRNLDAYYSGYPVETFYKLNVSDIPKETSNQEYILFKDHLMNNTDSLNALRLIEITKKYGYQKNSWLLLWHHRTTYNTNDYFWSYFKPFIKKQIEMKNIEKSFFAQFEDAVTSLYEGKQKYGTAWDNSVPIQDIKNVDNRRNEIDLPPLSYEHYIYGTPLPENYKMSYEELKKIILSNISKND